MRFVFRAALVLLTLLPAPVVATNEIGNVSAAQGTSEAERPGIRRALAPQAPVFQSEVVRTGDASRLEITFEDETRLNLGENARVRLDDFVYAMSGTTNQVGATVKGAFRFVTGTLGRKRPAIVRVRTPIGVIGIRGTDFWAGPIDGEYGVLLLDGEVEVTTASRTVVLDAPGLGTTIPRAGAAPRPPAPWAARKVDRALATVSFAAPRAPAESDFGALLRGARPAFDIRYRHEFVDSDAVPKDGNADTARTRLGVESGRVLGFALGADVEWITDFGRRDFNDSTGGRTRYPLIVDPPGFELNQLYLSADGVVPGTRFKLGRQTIQWDDERFVGSVDFRQNQQSFDAFRAQASFDGVAELEYAYFDKVRGVAGADSPLGRLGLRGHGLRARHDIVPGLTLSPFALLLDFERRSADVMSSATTGLRMTGDLPLSADWTFSLGGDIAHQVDFGDNPGNFGLWFYRIEPSVSYRGIRLRLGYESLDGDGADAFQLPLATGHKFNGSTDRFLRTPANGLRDLYAGVDAPLPGRGWYDGFRLTAAYHRFWAEESGTQYGSEWNVGLFKATPLSYGTLYLGVQYADYDAVGFSSDTRKLWLTVRFRFDADRMGPLFAAY